MSIESIFDRFWWPSYVPLKLTSISVNLIVSNYFLWTSPIVQMFDFLMFDIFLTFWQFFDILLKPPQPGTRLFWGPHHLEVQKQSLIQHVVLRCPHHLQVELPPHLHIYIHRTANGICRSPPRTQILGAKSPNQPLGWCQWTTNKVNISLFSVE